MKKATTILLSASLALLLSISACMQQQLNDCTPFEGAEYCAMQYEPVCAKLESGEWKTFGNGCSACISKDKVVGYVEGECSTQT